MFERSRGVELNGGEQEEEEDEDGDGIESERERFGVHFS